MGAPMRRSRDPLKLLADAAEAPWNQGFYQLLREIEGANPNLPRLGQSLRPQDDAVRLGQDPSLNFAPATFSEIQLQNRGAPPRLVQQFFGMFGPNGPLPLHLTEFARERLLHQRDPSFVRFLDVLHHRPLTLFYRAWAQAQPAASYDRPQADRFSAYVGALLGSGTASMRKRDSAGDHARLHFAGLLSRQVRTAEGLRNLLAGFFQLPVRIAEFAGHWMKLPANDLTRLGNPTQGAQLGVGVVLGSRVWDRQHRIRIAIGPLSLADYESLLPGGTALQRLTDLVRYYLGFELDWDLQLSLAKPEVPTAQLGGATRLGWTSWIGRQPRRRDAEDLVLDVERVVGTEHTQR